MKNGSRFLGSFVSGARRARVLAGGLALAAGLVAAAPAGAQVSTSQTTSNQLNQLFLFETTPNKSATGEGYVNGTFRYTDFSHDVHQFLYQVQGQYSFTDQLAVGGWIPVESVKVGDSHTGFGDVTVYGQYKLDQLVNHDILDLTAEADIVLPTGTFSKALDTGRFGFRPELLAYKDFGMVGPGDLGAYGFIGTTLTTHVDFRYGLAAQYEYQKISGVLELTGQAGDKMGAPLVDFTFGGVYRGLNPWEFALGVPIGLNDASPDWGVVVKVTYAFQK